MAPPPSADSSTLPPSLTPLQTLTTHLLAAPEPTLPNTLPPFLSTLYTTPLLTTALLLPTTRSSAPTVLLNKLKTRISSLLQSRTPQGKWAGVALAKACVESSPEALAGGWARTWVPLVVSLLGVPSPPPPPAIAAAAHQLTSTSIQRPEPLPTHILTLSTLSLIFNHLTLNKPALSRDLTTPHLKPFLEHVLNLLTPSNSTTIENPLLLLPCLTALTRTLSTHPTTFRPFAKRTHTLVLHLLSLPQQSLPPSVEKLAQELFVGLHTCATPSSSIFTPRHQNREHSGGNERVNTSTAVGLEFTHAIKATIAGTQDLLSSLFRSVLETPAYPPSTSSTAEPSCGGEGDGEGSNPLNLTPTAGIAVLIHRATVLLRLLSTFLTLPTSTQVSLPLGQILTLTHRILTLTPTHLPPNPSFGRVERDTLTSNLASLHTATLDLLTTLLRRLGSLAAPIVAEVIEQATAVFEKKGDGAVRAAVYTLLLTTLRSSGRGLQKRLVRSLHPILTAACHEILPPPAVAVAISAPPKTGSKKGKSGGGGGGAGAGGANSSTLADSLAHLNPTAHHSTSHPAFHAPITANVEGVSAAAQKLLTTVITHVNGGYVRSELRTLIERSSILSRNREAVLAGVLYPPQGGWCRGGLMPFLVGLDGGNGEGGALWEGAREAVCWPRMPVIRVHAKEKGEKEVESDAEEENEVEKGYAEDEGQGGLGVDRELNGGGANYTGGREQQKVTEQRWSTTFAAAAVAMQVDVPPPTHSFPSALRSWGNAEPTTTTMSMQVDKQELEQKLRRGGNAESTQNPPAVAALKRTPPAPEADDDVLPPKRLKLTPPPQPPPPVQQRESEEVPQQAQTMRDPGSIATLSTANKKVDIPDNEEDDEEDADDDDFMPEIVLGGDSDEESDEDSDSEEGSGGETDGEETTAAPAASGGESEEEEG